MDGLDWLWTSELREKFHFVQSQTDFPESPNCGTNWEIQRSTFSQMIYDVDSLWDLGALGIFPLS
jgi:hypothetical protein